jgi:hypothetical protein
MPAVRIDNASETIQMRKYSRVSPVKANGTACVAAVAPDAASASGAAACAASLGVSRASTCGSFTSTA